MRQIELLIPARNPDAGKAAVDHGADAVYIGGPAFGARAAAGNTAEEIARLAAYAHPYGVKVYAALNTLVYENELPQAEAVARDLLSAGVDALIIQDPAYLMMGLEGAVFHASTQMCNTTPGKVDFLARSGFARVVLERGLTLSQVKEINDRCGVETECFVHGAICVGHSGACYLSRSMGPRSGNRGECSQSCRLRYDLEDAAGNVLVRGKHLLSVRDLNLSGRIGGMLDAGVTSFKVEGRLKEIEYVKNITAYYRGVLDAEIAKRPGLRKSSGGLVRYDFTPDPAKSFSRGFTQWAADGMGKGVASFDTPKALGEPTGKVGKVSGDSFTLKNGGGVTLNPGDGICFISDGELKGTNINAVDGTKVTPNKMDGIVPGMQLYRNYDRKFTLDLERSRTRRSVPVDIECRFGDGGLFAVAKDRDGNRAEAFLPGSGETAADTERMLAVIETQMRKTGDTIYDVNGFRFEGHPGGMPQDGPQNGPEVPFFPVSVVNGFRRDLLEKLTDESLRAYIREKRAIPDTVSRDDAFPYPATHLAGDGNVTNSLSRRFWEMHGVRTFDTAHDLRGSLDGETVMVTPYCIRRELGICLKGSRTPGPSELYLRHGNHRYELSFDCRNCLMSLRKCGR